jgi:hypothetical protein
MNIAIQSNPDHTARTCQECARQRIENIISLGGMNILELCVGPSLKTFDRVAEELNNYNEVISVVGNDIDKKWEDYYPKGEWLIGDALQIAKAHHKKFDTAVFAPPLSKGCTGTREDSLMIDDVFPKYIDFLPLVKLYKISVLVLPARCVSTSWDREQFFKLLNKVYELERSVNIVDLRGNRNIRKYVDVYIN